MTVFLCINLVSCSDEENKDSFNNYNELIVGTWFYDGKDEMVTTFYGNGTGITLEGNQTENEGDVFRWYISDTLLTITFDNGNSDKIMIKELTKYKMIVTGYDSESGVEISETYIRK